MSGLTTEATSGALATSAAAWLTADEYLESVSFPLLTCSTIGLDPLAWSGNDLLSVSVACWLLVPGSVRLSLVLSPRLMRHRDQRDRHQQPDGENRETMPDAEPRQPVEHTCHDRASFSSSAVSPPYDRA